MADTEHEAPTDIADSPVPRDGEDSQEGSPQNTQVDDKETVKSLPEQNRNKSESVPTEVSMEGNSNPLEALSAARDALRKECDTLKATELTQENVKDNMDRLQKNAINVKNVLHSTNKVLVSFADTVEAMRNDMKAVSQILLGKLKKEFRPFTQEHKPSLEETEALQRVNESQKIIAQADIDLENTVRLAAEIEESSIQLAAHAEKAAAETAEREREAEALRLQEEKEKLQREKEEEERRKREEVERRKEEEDRKRQKEEEERKRKIDGLSPEERQKREEALRIEREAKDPKNWPLIKYTNGQDDEMYEKEENDMEEEEKDESRRVELFMAVRAKDGTFSKDQVSCDFEDQLDTSFTVQEHEELVSNVFCLSSTAGTLEFGEEGAWLVLPHYAPRGNNAKDIVVKTLLEGGEWTEVPTRETFLEDHKEYRFVEFCLKSLSNLSCAVITRLKEDAHKFNNRGGKLQSSVDPRVSMTLPKGAVRLSTEISLRVHPIDSVAITDLKSRHTVCKSVLASSPLVIMNGLTGKFNKPVSVILPTPGGASRKRPKTSTGPKDTKGMSLPARPTTAMPSPKRTKDEEGPAESIQLLTKSQGGQWTHRADKELTVKHDIVTFNLQGPVSRMILLRMQGECQSNELVHITKEIEEFLQERVACVVLRQKSEDLARVSIEICKSDVVDKMIQRLTQEGYDYGPASSDDVIMHEGQKIEISFRGNVNFETGQPLRVVYHSLKNHTRREDYIKEIDRFAQHSLEFYRGHAKFCTQSKQQVIVNEEENPVEQFDQLLCELSVTLPKPEHQPCQTTKAPLKIEDQGALTNEYFQQLSRDLGDEWRLLAEYLGLGKARIQSIIRDNYDSATDKIIRDMLVNWFKNAHKSADKVSILMFALDDVGREDLANDLWERNHTFESEAIRQAEEDKMKKAFKAVTDNPVCLREWRTLAHELKLSDAEIKEIDEQHRDSLSKREQCLAVLTKWREVKAAKATRKHLIKALKAGHMNAAAEKVSQVR